MSARVSVHDGIFAHWPNRITALRFVGSIVLFAALSIWCMGEVSHGGLAIELCFWLFITIAATDVLDGYLARRGNVVTAFGRIADPFVDKILVLGSMIFLSVMEWSRGWFPAWIVVVVLSREFLVTGIRGYVESLGEEFPADWFGKIKMVIQCVAIGTAFGLYAFRWTEDYMGFLSAATHVFVWGTLLSSVGSGASYVLKTKRILEKRAS